MHFYNDQPPYCELTALSLKVFFFPFLDLGLDFSEQVEKNDR